MELVTVVAALLVATGILGLVIPVLPGLAVVVAGVLLWAADHGGSTAWTIFGVCLAIAIIGWIVQYTVPGKRMKAAGVPTSTLLVGALCGIVGFFVIPVLGLFIGFVLGIFVIEQLRLHDTAAAWRATRIALKGVLMSIGIEFAAALLVAFTWIIGLVITR